MGAARRRAWWEGSVGISFTVGRVATHKVVMANRWRMAVCNEVTRPRRRDIEVTVHGRFSSLI